jgi:hypothetical protein
LEKLVFIMNFKIGLFSILALVAVTVFPSLDSPDNTSEYTPRDSMKKASSAEGMQWIYNHLRGNLETGKIESNDWSRMRSAVADHNRVTQGASRENDLTWIEMGPDNVGGRTRAVLVVDDQTVYAGSAGGGLWKSVNGGNNWSSVASFPQCIVGSISQTLNGDIYVGTGNDFEVGASGDGSSSGLGAGLFRSADDGETWSVIDGTTPAWQNSGSNWNAINTLEGDATDADRVWIGGDAGFGYYDAGNDDLVMGQQDGINNGMCEDIDMSADGSVMLVTIAPGRVHRSTDGGQSFDQLFGSSGVLPSSMGRARVSVSDVDPNHCFVLYATNGGAMGGVWHSGNGGANWNEVWPDQIAEYNPMGDNNQGRYDLALIQSAIDPETAFIGGVTMWKVTSQGQPEQVAFNFGFGAFDLYVHSDIHEFINAPNGDLYIGCDGGIFKSTDNGQTFFEANRGYNVTQFYGIGISSGLSVIGGTQDNGTLLIPGDNTFSTEQEAISVYGGDGFDCDISQATYQDQVIAFATSQNGKLGRFDSNGAGGQFFDDEIIDLQNEEGDIGGFYTCIRNFEDTEDEDSQQYVTMVNLADSNIYDPNPNDEELVQVTLFTNNLNIPFQYTFEEGDTLHYWPVIYRPEFMSTELLESDPNYWWLEPQDIIEETVDCEIDSIPIDTISVIDEIMELTEVIYWDTTIIIDDIPVTINDSIIVVIGSDTTYMDQINYDIIEECFTTYTYGADSVESVRENRQIIDNYTSLFSIAFNGTNGIWITREALNMNTSPDWWKVVNAAPGSGVKAQEFTADGNNLFYSSWGGSLSRLSGLDSLWSVEDVNLLDNTTILGQAGGTITGIAPDPNDVNHLVITIGGYGTVSNGKVRETWNALDDAPIWEDIWFPVSNDMARMPCYDAIIDVSDESGQTIVVGTEFGVYVTDTGGGADGTEWVQRNDPMDPAQSTGIDACPTFSVRQQQIATDLTWRAPTNKGTVYAGTHGRGIFRSEALSFVGIDEQDDFAQDEMEQLLVYPNPTSENIFMNVDLNGSQDINLYVYNLRGELVLQQEKIRKGQGNHTLSMNISGLSTGTYIIHMDAGDQSSTGKFVVLD